MDSEPYRVPPIPPELADELEKAIHHIWRSESGHSRGGGGWQAGTENGLSIFRDCMLRLVEKHRAEARE